MFWFFPSEAGTSQSYYKGLLGEKCSKKVWNKRRMTENSHAMPISQGIISHNDHSSIVWIQKLIEKPKKKKERNKNVVHKQHWLDCLSWRWINFVLYVRNEQKDTVIREGYAHQISLCSSPFPSLLFSWAGVKVNEMYPEMI